MTIWFVSRHPGAVTWAARHAVAYDRHVRHLDTGEISARDTVIGSLPVNLAAEVCARGAEYWNLSLRLKPTHRGRELTADELEQSGAMLERYDVRPFP